MPTYAHLQTISELNCVIIVSRLIDKSLVRSIEKASMAYLKIESIQHYGLDRFEPKLNIVRSRLT
jgi:hypothetical protein